MYGDEVILVILFRISFDLFFLLQKINITQIKSEFVKAFILLHVLNNLIIIHNDSISMFLTRLKKGKYLCMYIYL